jgi:hypothetical protein
MLDFRPPTGRARTISAALCGLLLLVPASAALSKTRWNVHLWQRLRAAHRVSPDTGLDQSYRRLALYLPSQGVVGFQVVGVPDDRSHEFRLQYALAPRRIVRSTQTEFVIECGPAGSVGSLGSNPQFVLVSAPGDDVRLFRRVQP